MSETASYKTVVKNTAIVGGSQAVQMLASLLRNKVAAIFLGATGMGVNVLIFGAISVVQQFASMGIFQSGIREIASARNNYDVLSSKVKIFRKLSVFSGLLGVVVCIILAPVLSKISFGNFDYIWHFIAVSITLFFMALQGKSSAIMQGTGNIRLLALASITGAAGNLVAVVICYYFWGVNGIVPALITGYLIFSLVNRYFEKKIPFKYVPNMPAREVIAQSRPVLKQGSALMLSQLLMVTFAYLLSGFIRLYGSIPEAAFFNAAATICVSAMAVVYSTLGSDYFPRLSAINDNREEINRTVNRQADIMLLIVLPISLMVVVAAPWIVRTVLTREFLIIVPMLRVMGLSFVFRALWNVFGFIILAKSDNKTYLLFDVVIGNGSGFILNIIAFYVWGLIGLGISYLVIAVFMAILLGGLVHFKYGVRLDSLMKKKLIFMFLISVATFLCVIFLQGTLSHVILGGMTVGVIIYCCWQLDKLIGIRDIIKRRLGH